MYNRYLTSYEYISNRLIDRALNSQNNKSNVLANVQSAGNSIGSSETTRQLSYNFITYLAGVIDGDGNFDIRNNNGTLTLKAIRIKLHVRDIKILNFIQNNLHMGRVKTYKNNPYAL